VAGPWFSTGTPVSSTNKTDHHDMTEILLKVVLNTISLTLSLEFSDNLLYVVNKYLPINKKLLMKCILTACLLPTLIHRSKHKFIERYSVNELV
jgi:hypothetical protein